MLTTIVGRVRTGNRLNSAPERNAIVAPMRAGNRLRFRTAFRAIDHAKPQAVG